MADTDEIVFVIVDVQSKLACSAGGDVTPPTLTVVSPPAGGSIQPGEAFVVDVTDNVGIRLLAITVELGSTHEVVWLRDAFGPSYVGRSSRTAITDGYRYTIARAGGWNASPTFHVEAVDVGGNLGT